jgi:rfaE bifunctional protein nucleotidyltransferase chain/domain
MDRKKIFNIKSIKKVLKRKNKTVLCHGVFDVLHYGHLKYFEAAKKYGNFLIVSVTQDKYVDKGHGRPFFNDKIRMETLASLSIVDAVVLSESESSKKIIEMIKPNFYAKGMEYKISKNDITKKILIEKKAVKENNGKIIFIDEKVYSSSKLINIYSNNFNKEQSIFIKNIKKKYSNSYILESLKKILNQKTLVIGESILDKYIYVSPLGKSGKEPYLAFLKENTEYYLGGGLAISNQLNEFSKHNFFISLIGKETEFNRIIKKKLPKSIKLLLLKKNNVQTIVKTRYVDNISKQKIFGTYDMDELVFSDREKINLYNKIKKISKKVDNIIIADYGHGLISPLLAKKICKLKTKISLNAQINAANVGFHHLRNYKNINNLIINEAELRSEFKDRNSTIAVLSSKLIKRINCKYLVVTQGKNGAIIYKKDSNRTVKCPAFTEYAIDKIGSGDNMLSIISLALNNNVPIDLAVFYGNILGSLSVQVIANKHSITFEKIYRTLETLIK